MDDAHDLELLLRSRVPLILAETPEEQRLIALFQRRVPALGRPLFRWSVAEGLRRIDFDAAPQRHAADPGDALRQILATRSPGIYLLADFHPYLQDPVHVRLMKEVALGHSETAHTLVLVSHSLELPPELRPYAAHFHLALPDRKRLTALVEETATDWARDNGRRVRTDRPTLERLVENLLGLTVADARRLVRGAICDDGAITETDLPEVMQAKFRLMERSGAISFEYDTARFADVGGLRRLREWLELRRPAFTGSAPGLDPPRGILLVGVQGAGKSLAAKATAGLFGLPLLRLDMGSLYAKFYGESERNLREALATAEVVAPCVLWIDEIEKALATGGGDEDGLSRRMLGSLLTWMAERRARVFLVATANAIDQLPPELLRKGRMDEIFFVDLPEPDVRRDIFAIHLRRREVSLPAAQLERLAAATDGFSGAEIEQAVVAALYRARSDGGGLDADHLLAEIEATRPLSVVMAERIDALRHWAAGRTVPAD